MKNLRYFMISVIVFYCWFVYQQPIHSQTAPAQIAISHESPFNPAMSLEIALDKTEYLQLEPIILRCRFVNKTTQAQSTFIPSFDQHSSLEVAFNGESKQFDQITYLMSFLIFPPEPAVFQPEKGVEQDLLLETNLKEFFPEPGTYNINLTLKSGFIRSNSLAITVKEPKGIDKKAFDFIQRHKANSTRNVLFNWNYDFKLENGKTLLEEFVSRYSDSVYGEIAVYQLGNYYFAKREYEKAKIELGKLRNSKNPRIAKDAKSRLTDVEKYCPTILPKDSNQR